MISIRTLTFVFTLLMVGISIQGIASPSISIGNMYDVLKPDESNMVKRIYNSGDTTAFVRVDVIEIDSHGKENNHDDGTSHDQIFDKQRLIVTPLRMIIPPSGFQSVRIIWPGKRDKEYYYRIRFTPVLPDEKEGFNLSHEEQEQYRKKQLTAGVNILTGYGSLIYILPHDPVFHTEIKKGKNTVSFNNNGNATVVLDKIRYCANKDKKCNDAGRSFVLPGRNITLKKPDPDGEFSLILVEGNIQKEMSI